jgi:predicted GNAT family acetyltransferase|tara:strand:+ start:257 stop:550 length:294 start_codon:yes stop_codon:yes gene_type:complete
MESYNLHNNDFLRQFEVKIKGKLARIEYAEQERKIFLTKISIPDNIGDPNFKNWFIKKVLDYVEKKNIKVVPTSPEIAIFLRKNKNYKKLLPVGIKL